MFCIVDGILFICSLCDCSIIVIGFFGSFLLFLFIVYFFFGNLFKFIGEIALNVLTLNDESLYVLFVVGVVGVVFVLLFVLCVFVIFSVFLSSVILLFLLDVCVIVWICFVVGFLCLVCIVWWLLLMVCVNVSVCVCIIDMVLWEVLSVEIMCVWFGVVWWCCVVFGDRLLIRKYLCVRFF